MSKKQAAKIRAFKAGGMPEGQLCEICGLRPATDADHIQKRCLRPDLVADPNNRRWLCRPCHSEPGVNRTIETYEKANKLEEKEELK